MNKDSPVFFWSVSFASGVSSSLYSKEKAYSAVSRRNLSLKENMCCTLVLMNSTNKKFFLRTLTPPIDLRHSYLSRIWANGKPNGPFHDFNYHFSFIYTSYAGAQIKHIRDIPTHTHFFANLIQKYFFLNLKSPPCQTHAQHTFII